MNRRLAAIAAIVVVAVAALAPVVITGGDDRMRAAQALCLLAAAIGLAIAVGLGGLPSLGQGAFVGVGAYTTAILRHHHAGPIAATAAGIGVAGAAGVVLALGIGPRARVALVALTTWLAAWIFTIAVGAFPGLTGGARGIVLGPVRQRSGALGITVTAGPAALLEISLVAALLAAGLFLALRRRYGAAFAAVRADPSAAAAAGVPVTELRRLAMVASAVVGGLAGAVTVQVVGVADPTAYGALLSVKLLIAVVIGGAETVVGPAVGLVSLVVVTRMGSALADLFGRSRLQLEPVAAAVLLIPVLLLGGSGLVRRRRAISRPRHVPAADSKPVPPGSLVADNITVVFGGVIALDGVSVRVRPGTCHAISGHNGSGKSTLLKVLAGAIEPTSGRVIVGGPVARTLQRLAVAPDVIVLDHVISGAEPTRTTGPIQAALATPMSRTEDGAVEQNGWRLLDLVGLADRAGDPAARLDSAEQRLVQIARALAARPSVLLLDEPAAGLGVEEQRRLIEVLRRLKSTGLTLVLVEHRAAVVDALADEITVLSAGRLARTRGTMVG